MRCDKRWSLLLVAAVASKVSGDSRKAEPSAVNFHAAHAAHSADVAEQAAVVANRVAAHTQDVAHSTATALRYTRDALRQANADERVLSGMDKEMEIFESEEEGRHNPLAQAESEETDGTEGKEPSATAGQPKSLDIDTAIAPQPNGVEPFGQEEPARELTKASIEESNGMVDQIENAQGVEAKRSVFRALTKLRGATIASYDGMARAHLSNVDNYNKKHKWREEHYYRHLAEEEGDVSEWAFPRSGKKVVASTSDSKVPPGIAAGPAAAF